jgi:7-cyano-7-deazaguanine synthase
VTATVVLVSGGLDSVTLAHHLARDSASGLHLVAADYGQRHVRELDYARRCAARLRARIDVVDLRSLTPLLRNSSLTDDRVDVPSGHYADESMRLTVVPNRNAILLAVAYAAAVSDGADAVATAVHAGDHPIYPDCRPAFIEAFDAMETIATEGFAPPGILRAPFVRMTKTDIVRLGAELAVPFAETWSCYRGGDRHCGTCGTCVERREAFQEAGVPDPTLYEPTS